VDAHEKVLQSKGVGEEVILAAIRIASVVHALAAVFEAEAANVASPVTA
jgi:alkyl hydroperoxide reductase subunit D